MSRVSISFVRSELSVLKCWGDVEPQAVSAFLVILGHGFMFFMVTITTLLISNQIDSHLLTISVVKVRNTICFGIR